MIFIGDIAYPKDCKPAFQNIPKELFRNTVANLEGAIVKKGEVSNTEYKLFNDEEVVDFLNQLDVVAVSLGNNHITDVEGCIGNTYKQLAYNNILGFGAGKSLEEAQKPAIVHEEGETYALLSFGWNVIGCEYAKQSKRGVNPLTTSNLLKNIKKTKSMYPDAKIVISFHWDYELALYPQPLFRQLARIAVDAGAAIIIGHHAHCVQGYELYKGCPIMYGIGNWFIPDEIFFDGKLSFPMIAKRQMALEWKNNKLIFHWFDYDGETHTISYIKSENVDESDSMREMSPFINMEHKEYIKWYKYNRNKKILLPFFKNINNPAEVTLKTLILLLRQRIIYQLLLWGIKRPNLKNVNR